MLKHVFAPLLLIVTVSFCLRHRLTHFWKGSRDLEDNGNNNIDDNDDDDDDDIEDSYDNDTL